ncbi:transcriptional regulator [Caulobacter sp. UNC279MFTsu5.1]|uniref:winged helix-turn-helix domain-containing protein n=1 Tax=Caulobacter sp. UNC279MFTsu5.1 TaxID=1502775 RepID=UPI001C43218C|nr:transcriptional regulator [Caulobacter sp. UNC279MFTsu5.1]
MAIGARALELLTVLVERPGELISKRELIARVWPDTFVGEANLKVNIATLRKALGDPAKQPDYIGTVTGRGYRFVATVRDGDAPGPRANLAKTGAQSVSPASAVGLDEAQARLQAVTVSRLMFVIDDLGHSAASLAIAVARTVEDGQTGRVVFVDLKSVEGVGRTPEAVAAALLAAEVYPLSPSTLPNPTSRKMLLVLDSAKDVAGDVALCLGSILEPPVAAHLLAAGTEPWS